MIKRTGAYTIAFESQPVIAGWGSVVGKKEAEGPLKNYFDKIIYDSYDGCDTFEQAESMFQGEALEKALERSKTHANEVDCVFAGDLLNQCIGSSFGLMKLGIPYLRLVFSVHARECALSRAVRCMLDYGTGSCARRLSGRERRGRPPACGSILAFLLGRAAVPFSA